MSRKCELSNVGVLYGNKVSHSQIKTRRRFEPNIRVVKFVSNVLGQKYKLSVTARCIRSVEKLGGFDEYMLKTSENLLSTRAKTIKKMIIQRKNQVAL
jgi:large subunit ribosomal protein L28